MRASDPEQKRQLPHPYNRDLSRILRSLRRRHPISRRSKKANDPVTAAYLAAAMRLVERHLGPRPQRELDVVDDPDSVHRPLFQFLSQREVANEVNRNPPPFPRVGRVATLRERWERHSHFIADLLRFGLWAEHYPAQLREDVKRAEKEVFYGPDRVGGLHRLCYWYITRLRDTPAFRLELVAVAGAEGDTVISDAIAERHRENAPRWKLPFEVFLRTRGLRLRPGIEPADCSVILSALAEGLAVRALGDPGAHVVDDERQRSLLGTAALMLTAGAVVSADGDHASLEEAVGAMMNRGEGN